MTTDLINDFCTNIQHLYIVAHLYVPTIQFSKWIIKFLTNLLNISKLYNYINGVNGFYLDYTVLFGSGAGNIS